MLLFFTYLQYNKYSYKVFLINGKRPYNTMYMYKKEKKN